MRRGPSATLLANDFEDADISPDGRYLAYLNPGMQLMAVPVRQGADRLGRQCGARLSPRLFRRWPPGRFFDVSPDGERFLVFERGVDDTGDPPELILIQNWVERLKRLVPVE